MQLAHLAKLAIRAIADFSVLCVGAFDAWKVVFCSKLRSKGLKYLTFDIQLNWFGALSGNYLVFFLEVWKS